MIRPWKIGAVSAGAAAALAGAVWLGMTLAVPNAPVAPAPSTGTTAAVESACNLPGGGTPKDVTWESEAGWPLPVSTTDGPGRRDEHAAWSCFARTETGAVVAAYDIAIRVGGVADDWKTVAKTQTLPGPGRDVLLGTVPNAPTVVTPRGYTVAAYDGTKATVRYYLTTPSVELACNLDVQWVDGDWKLRLQSDGSTSSDCQQGAPQTFTPWGPA